MKPAHGLLTTLLALLLVAFSVSAFAQNDDDCQTIEGVKGTSVSVDPNGNVYVIDGSTLYKGIAAVYSVAWFISVLISLMPLLM